MATEEHTLRPDFHLVVEPHNLEYWNIPEYRDKIASIETVWLFDRNVHVHCAELTPSYEMWPVETRVNLKVAFADEEELRNDIEDIVHSNSDYDIGYQHVHDVEAWLKNPQMRHKRLGDIGDGVSYEEESYEEQRDAAIERCRCNTQI
jgi:hypothetical protein